MGSHFCLSAQMWLPLTRRGRTFACCLMSRAASLFTASWLRRPRCVCACVLLCLSGCCESPPPPLPCSTSWARCAASNSGRRVYLSVSHTMDAPYATLTLLLR